MEKRRNERRFTLVELILVITIIAVIAGLLVPQLSTIGRSVDMAATAKTQGDVANNIQLYFTLQKRYPMYMDSLLVATQSYQDPTGLYDPQEDPGSGEQITGLPDSGPHLDRALVMEDIGTTTYNTNTYLRSLSRSGFEQVLHHDRGELDSNSSGKFFFELPNGKSVGQTFLAAVIDDDENNAGAQTLIKGLLGHEGLNEIRATNPPKLVAFGFGPHNSAIGKTCMQAPVYPGCDGRYYGRYVAIFKVYPTGERATLVGVVDSYGRYLNYSMDQYHESLPDGSRRG